MPTDELTHEVHKLFVQKENDHESFDQITDAINDHATRITALMQWCGQLGRSMKADAESADSKIAQNAAWQLITTARLSRAYHCSRHK